jgi:hypothetical protein
MNILKPGRLDYTAALDLQNRLVADVVAGTAE